jgi:hypothetical protein
MALKLNTYVEDFNRNQFFNLDQPVFSDSDFKAIQKYFFDYVEQIPEPLRYLNCANHPDYRPAIANWVGRDEILNVVKPLLGDDLIFWSIGVCYKPANSLFEVGWHIDSHCWMRDKVLYPPDALVLFLSLTEMTEQNGAMEIIPELNIPKFYNHDRRDPEKFFFEHEITTDELGGRKPHLVTMAENRICGFTAHMPHKSGPNRSHKPRLGITLRYLQSSVRITGTPLDGRDSYLISGIDKAGNKYTPIEKRESIPGLSR